MSINRRQFLHGLGAAAASSASFAAMGNTLNVFNQSVADSVNDYKAIVCVFLLGGMDNHDTIIPYDQASYDRYAQIRAPLLSRYGNRRARANLLVMSPNNSATFNGRQFAMAPELPKLHALFQQGNAALVGNVGPLIHPLKRNDYENLLVKTPTRLFSHNDQQATWMSSSPEGAQFGWGGFFADALLAGNPNGSPEFTTITSGGNELFLTGSHSFPYQIGRNGSIGIEALEDLNGNATLRERLLAHFKASQFTRNNIIEQDVSHSMTAFFDSNTKYNQSLANATNFTTQFPTTDLGSQLRAVARTISVRDSLAMKRQVFIVGMGGFDTHSAQVQAMPRLHQQIDDAVSAFYQSMGELGLNNNVTLFTASDFGRTLAVNGDGTDHGWGGHHFVVGGAVNGKHIYGDIPNADFGHDHDAGSGRLIPSTSVEQFAEPLGRWFGLNETQINTALPNLRNFSTRLNYL
ncbi:DUF1501 domain-containing protein [Pleionea sp. CnH1-48]|uniref:DUF1501 domain-containing protein n=1 Tax=Pleionea sp. CnH1-48 TaxID=2954494 RepID=UPI00209722DA|nr:DUF1501 domain-containing protein [Pleionea sp. CnH1-48]MCO7226059.1 DUF1501 domain-containing protein [Pleionea sp. CnH1-48]